MYRLIIVDDNSVDRAGIRKVFDWNSMGIEIAGVFSDGRQALEDIEVIKPHIILTDIAMPEMDGIELAKEVKILLPKTRIIFMSCYEDFNYARSAVKLDISDYVLKPIIADNLKKAVLKVVEQLEQESAQQTEREIMMKQIQDSFPALREQFARELLFGTENNVESIQNRMEFLKLDIVINPVIRVIYVQIDESDYQENISCLNTVDRYITSYSVNSIISSYGSINRNIYTVQLSPRQFVAIFISNKSIDWKQGEEGSEGDIIDIAVAINENISKKLKVNSLIGISKPSGNLLDIPELYQQSEEAIKTKFYTDGNPVILYEEIEEVKHDTFDENVNVETLFKDVKSTISIGNDTVIYDFIDRYFGTDYAKKEEHYIKSLAIFIINAIQIVLIENGYSMGDIFNDEMLVWKKLNKIGTIVDIRQWLYNIFRALKEYLDSRNTKPNAQIVDKIKETISNKYSEALTMGDIAASVYLSASYANNIFKEETGMTIFDYLTQYRIEAAKKLLKEPNSRIYLTAQQVGYTNKSHFCLLFKKYTGMTPSEYKENSVL